MTYIVFTNPNGIHALSPSLATKYKGFANNNLNIAAFNQSGNGYLIDTSVDLQNPLTESASVILISDSETIPDRMEGLASKINTLLNNETELYVIYHNNINVGYLQNHKTGMNACFTDKIKGELVSSHIAESSPLAKYYAALEPFSREKLNSLKKLFPNPELEAMLETLDKCLSPQDAANADLINNFHLIKSKKVPYKINGNDASQTVENFINTQLANQTNCETPEYIQSLTYLRIALLGE